MLPTLTYHPSSCIWCRTLNLQCPSIKDVPRPPPSTMKPPCCRNWVIKSSSPPSEQFPSRTAKEWTAFMWWRVKIYFGNVMEKLKIDLSGNCCAFHTIKLNSVRFLSWQAPAPAPFVVLPCHAQLVHGAKNCQPFACCCLCWLGWVGLWCCLVQQPTTERG